MPRGAKLRRAYSDRVLDASANPRRLGEVEEHVSWLTQSIDLERMNNQIAITLASKDVQA
jgi:hypothetical protein